MIQQVRGVDCMTRSNRIAPLREVKATRLWSPPCSALSVADETDVCEGRESAHNFLMEAPKAYRIFVMMDGLKKLSDVIYARNHEEAIARAREYDPIHDVELWLDGKPVMFLSAPANRMSKI